MKISVKFIEGISYKMFKMELPFLPHKDDYLSSDKQGFGGYVKEVIFYEDEDGILEIEVAIK